MATYVISDIHGAYDHFIRLLQKINFRYDGQDTLYLLGDYIDWGPDPIRTLLMIMDLDERYPFVHCAMGNHELMFLQTLESGFDGIHSNDVSDNWLYTNHGLHTWLEFLSLPDRTEESIVAWLCNLRLSYTVNCGCHTYMLAHAYPYYYDMPYTPAEARRHMQDALWHRMLLFEDPFRDYDGPEHYDGLICGHTISDSYYQELYRIHAQEEADSQPVHPLCPGGSNSFMQPFHNRIFYGRRFIDIDCGAKCLGMDPSSGQSVCAAVARSQLAALRLEDMAEFYVRNTVFQSSVPQVNEMAQSARDYISRYMHTARMQLSGTTQK